MFSSHCSFKSCVWTRRDIWLLIQIIISFSLLSWWPGDHLCTVHWHSSPAGLTVPLGSNNFLAGGNDLQPPRHVPQCWGGIWAAAARRTGQDKHTSCDKNNHNAGTALTFVWLHKIKSVVAMHYHQYCFNACAQGAFLHISIKRYCISAQWIVHSKGRWIFFWLRATFPSGQPSEGQVPAEVGPEPKVDEAMDA